MAGAIDWMSVRRSNPGYTGPNSYPAFSEWYQRQQAGRDADFARAQEQENYQQKYGNFQQFLGDAQQRGLLAPNTSSSSSSSSGGGVWTPTPHVTLGGGATAGAGIAGGVAPASSGGAGNPANASSLAFARAKDTVGQSLRGLMTALGDRFSARGIGGSSIEANAIGNTLAQGNAQLADVAREGAIKESDVANDLAKLRYQGEITQRGQDLQHDIANRSFNSQSQSSSLASILGLMNAFSSLY